MPCPADKLLKIGITLPALGVTSAWQIEVPQASNARIIEIVFGMDTPFLQ
jgi:hypothetical protein